MAARIGRRTHMKLIAQISLQKNGRVACEVKKNY